MNKAEAVKIVRNIYQTDKEKEKEALETLIPELKENEDEKMRKMLISLVENSGEWVIPKNKEKVLTWLKSLRLQPKQEWSEEDEWKIVELKTFIAQCNGFNKANQQKAFNMIDALRPSWKPSEKQINMLRVIVEREKEKPLYGIDGYSPAAVLESLYNDLKKLM